MSKRFGPVIIVVMFGVAALLGACGSDSGSTKSSAANGQRTIKVEMSDDAFSPTTVTAKAGETIRFEFDNVGKDEHEAIIGDARMQADHEKEMMSGADKGSHGGGHDGMKKSDAITVKPGGKGELIHTFKAGQDLLIGCHEPGHYAAGMKLQVSAA